MKSPVIHYHAAPGCETHRGHATSNIGNVTCRRCRRRISAMAALPAVPTFAMEPTGDGRTGQFRCPVCGKVNVHGLGDGHRAAHCRCWRHGYCVTVPAPMPAPVRGNEGPGRPAATQPTKGNDHAGN